MGLCLALPNSKRALFVAIGGGGDVALAATLAYSYERCGGEAFIGSIAWERYVYDIVPGPIRLSEIEGVLVREDGYVIVDGNSYAVRGGKALRPQAVRAAKALNREVVVFDIYEGPRGLYRAIANFAKSHSVDIVVGVDVGGDSVAKGYEESLWSPLADAIGVAALAHMNGALLALSGPGADGELPVEYVLERVAEIARLGGLKGGYVLSEEDAALLETVLSEVKSEASAVLVRAFKGSYGVEIIRGGTRSVKVSPLLLVTFFLDATVVARSSVSGYIYGADDLYEARSILNRLHIYTELDLEEDIYAEVKRGVKLEELNLLEIKKKGVLKLIQRGHHYEAS